MAGDLSETAFRLEQQQVMLQMEAVRVLREALRAERVYVNRFGKEHRQPDWYARVLAAKEVLREYGEGVKVPPERVEIVWHTEANDSSVPPVEPSRRGRDSAL